MKKPDASYGVGHFIAQNDSFVHILTNFVHFIWLYA